MMFAPDVLAGRVAVVTGAGTGIGVGISEALVGAGATVVVSYYSNAAGAEALAARLGQQGPTLAHQCDVRDDAHVQALFDTTLATFGRIDILVNNSGVTKPKSLLEMTTEDWNETLDINLRGAFYCTQRAAREMIGQGSGGRIINLSSVHGFGAVPDHSHYEASKGGINLFTKACAIELAPYNIQVNAIAPGAIEVERYHTPEYDREKLGSGIPAGRVGFPSDIGPLAVFLSSDAASYITGQIVWVDGGLISRLGGLGR